MAGPFQKAPTFGEYLEWLRNNTRYGCKQGLALRKYFFTRIHDEDDVSVAELLIDHSERLVPTTVGRLDDLLGVDSPFGKIRP